MWFKRWKLRIQIWLLKEQFLSIGYATDWTKFLLLLKGGHSTNKWRVEDEKRRRLLASKIRDLRNQLRLL
jgi:hypothetical protein